MTTDLSLFTWIWLLLPIPIFVAALSKWDPVGRRGGRGVGPQLDARVGWFAMEIPCLFVLPGIYLTSGNHYLIGTLVVLLWIVHYTHRTLIWPWFIPRRGAKIPVTLALFGLGFNVVNGYLIGSFIANVSPDQLGLADGIRYAVGAAIMLGGATLNIWSDYSLRAQRLRSTERYVLPRGGAFEWVSCPNLLGEIVEWSGLAFMTWSIPGLAFVLWTSANLIPRAMWRHQQYQRMFADYPHQRRTLIPFATWSRQVG